MKYMTVSEFRDLGFLQELNRLFLHPLGLALEIKIEENGEESLGGIWDSREDPEGMLFGDFSDKKEARRKIEYVEALRKTKIKARSEAGCNSKGIQEIDK